MTAKRDIRRVLRAEPGKIRVEGHVVARGSEKWPDAHIAQMVEHFLGKEEVIGSNPIVSTICRADRHVRGRQTPEA